MNVKLKYGFRGLEVSLPESAGFAGMLPPKEAVVVSNPCAVVERELLRLMVA